MRPPSRARLRRGIPLRALAPNVITAMALCSGLTAVRFAIAEQWEWALGAIVIAGVLDGVDGRVARLLHAESRFGAELDSLSDVIAFGVAPALVTFLWTLKTVPRLGWLFAIAYVLCCALRLARFNAAIDSTHQPHKSAGFLTGVPAPAAAGLALLPMFVWVETQIDWIREPHIVALWLALIAFLMISSIATLGWGALRPRRTIRLEVILLTALAGGAMFSAPWIMLSAACAVYLLLIPYGMRRYSKLRARSAVSSQS